MKLRVLSAALISAACLALSACGGDDSNDPTVATTTEGTIKGTQADNVISFVGVAVCSTSHRRSEMEAAAVSCAVRRPLRHNQGALHLRAGLLDRAERQRGLPVLEHLSPDRVVHLQIYDET
jgi:hypothetical protein